MVNRNNGIRPVSDSDMTEGAPLPERGKEEELYVSPSFNVDPEDDPVSLLRHQLTEIEQIDPQEFAMQHDISLKLAERKLEVQTEYLVNTLALAESDDVPIISDSKIDYSPYAYRGDSTRDPNIPAAYMLTIGGEIVVQNKPNIIRTHNGPVKEYQLNSVFADTQGERFRIRKLMRKKFFGSEPGDPHYTDMIKDCFGDYGFIAGRAQLTGRAAKIAAAFFNRVSAMEEISPKKAKKTFREIEKGLKDGSEYTERKLQHWGQEYLSKLKPDSVTHGVIFGSGETCNAYQFGTGENAIVVIEANRTENATIVIKPSALNDLATLHRHQIRDSQDELIDKNMLVCRINHPAESLYNNEAREAWIKKVTELVEEAQK